MMSDLSANFKQVKETFSEASDALNYDLWSLVSEGPVDLLNQTEKTQPAMLAAGIAVFRSWQSVSALMPTYFAGHSLGEYTALVAADSIGFADAIKLVEMRGQFMQNAVPAGEGAMAAILGLTDDDVRSVCHEAAEHGVVEAVNFNSPGQVVIAGSASAVNPAIEIAKAKGAKRALLLPVSVPSHCALMKPAAEQLAEALSQIEIKTPSTPVIHNASVTSEDSSDVIKNLLAMQLHSPVRWVETVQCLASNGVSTLVECGPGKVLTGLTKRIDKTLSGIAIYDDLTIKSAIETLGE
jgi:[acyl-carrier-protein] S-malonyltransferase